MPDQVTQPLRSRVLEQDLAHFRRMVEQTRRDPALARETALWEALAAEVDEYLRPPEIAAHELLLPLSRGP